MIGSFANEETRKIHSGVPSKKLPRDVQRIARRKLLYLDAAENLQDLRVPPGNRVEKLKVIGEASTASASMTNGASVPSGRIIAQRTLS